MALPAASVRLVPDAAEDVRHAQRWWDALAEQVPEAVAGLWFGIFTADQGGQTVRTLYVVGTDSFDADDETAEWAAGDYLWEPEGRYVVLPVLASLPEQPYDVPLAHASDALRQVRPWTVSARLGAAVGYDDGDVVVLHAP